jgi:release factor glutamine methyltransferase
MLKLTGLTIAQARRALSNTFAASGLEDAEADARILIGAALNLDHASLASRGDLTIAEADAERIEGFAARRLAFEPVARILGEKEFWSLALRVTPAVLVPRPDTETLVELALDHVLAGGLRKERLRVLDIGVGSGAILLALLSELPNATGLGIDISFDALSVARDNAQRHGLDARCQFVETNFTGALSGPFDLIVSNPPYIARAEIEQLAADVRDYDPALALDGGFDGLDAYRAIIADAARLLAPGGRLVLELGLGQGSPVASLIEAGGLTVRGRRNDLVGIERAISAGLLG